ncbi:amino acid adenylation domain-containing protein, partial [Pedobacter steynii]
IPGVYVFEGALNIGALERSFLTLIERHEILRTVFKESEETEEVRQFILPFESVDFKIDYQDFRAVTDRDKVVKERVTAEFRRPFDLSRYPLLRAGLYQLTDHQWVFSYVVQHIISDGWSMGVLIRELLSLYNAYVAGAAMPLAPLRIQYKDYAAWQQSELSGDQLHIHKNYWMDQFSGQLPVLDLPVKGLRPPVKTYNGGLIFKKIDTKLTEGLRLLCQEEGGTLFMGLIAAVNVLLYHYAGQEDIIVGSPIAGREHADLEGQIGFYVNTLALRNRFSGKDSYLEVFRGVKGVTLDAYDHQVYPFDKLVEELNLKRDMSRNPLFDVLVDFHSLKTDVTVTPQGLAELKVRNYMAEESLASKFDLTFYFNDLDGGLGLSLEYNSDLFDRSVVEALSTHFENLLTAVLSSAGLPVAELDILTAAEKERQLIDFNIPQGPDLSYRPLLGIFAEQVKKNPEGIALSMSGRSVTYQELDVLSDQLAFYLHQTYDIKANELVGIELERTEWMVIAILGILKSGAAYVPIDPAYPKLRKGFLSTDTGIRVLITQTDHIFDLDYFSGPVFAIDVQLAGLNAVIPESFKAVAGSSDLAYVIYTSGSTGIPKGCAISHGSLSNYIQWANSHYFDGITAVCFGLYTSLSFDLTVTSIFCSLTQGGRLFIYEQYEELSAILRHSFGASSGINSVKLTPSHINVLKYLELSSATVSVAIVGGEALTEEQVGILKKINPSIRIYNEYGPTEATVGCMVSELSEGMSVLIGKPISNTRIYLLNDRLGFCPPGTTGEIYISGSGLAKGYLNDETLTKLRFLPDPYAPDALMYKTGDLGKWLSDGNMVYLGRKDDQVKINGYRIEVGEVVHGLQQHADVELAVVLLNPDESGAQQLVAYVVGSRDLSGAELRSHLMNSLPVYMVPFQYVQVESIPLTINGKVDQQALLELKPGDGHQKVAYVAPETEVEIKLVALWEQILHKENIGLKDNFFELGGDSLKATRLVNQLHKVFDVKITLRDVFELATLEEQGFLLGQEEKEIFSTIDPVPPAENYVLSSAQRRLWTLSQSYETSISYNLPDVKILEGALDRNALEGALRSLVLRHEMLRTVFRRDESGEVRQFVLSGPEAGISLVFRDLRLLGDQQELLDELLEKDAFEIFDLTTGPLLRTHLFQMEDHKWVFAYNMHHIIRDGWSMSIMIKETFLYYNALLKGENLQLSPLRIQYKDYAVWQQAKLKANSFADHKDYWLEKFSGELPVFRPSEAENRSAVSPYNGGTRNLVIDSPSYHGLKALSQKNGGSLFMGVLTIVNALLSAYTEKQDLIVGTLVSGREHIDLENQIGYYVNTLPLRFKFEPEDSYDDLFNRIREVTLEGFKHQAYPFDNLVDDLAAVGRKGSAPLFNVMVVLHNMTGIVSEQTNFGKLKITAYPGKMKFKSRFDLTFDFTEMQDKLYVIIRYNRTVYGEDTMDKYVGHLMSLIDLICADSAQRIDCLYDVKDRI